MYEYHDSEEAQLVWENYQKKLKKKKGYFVKTPGTLGESFTYEPLNGLYLTKKVVNAKGGKGQDYYEDEAGNTYLYCQSCEKIKELNNNNFYKQHTKIIGYRTPCKSCENLIQKYKRDANPELRERLSKQAKEWRKNNKERDRKNKRNLQREKRKDPEYRKKYNEYHRKYREENRDIILKNQQDYDQRVREDPVRYNSKRIRSSFSCFLDKCCKPEDKTDLSTEEVFEICGYTIEEFKRHIESQFHSGMTWENQSTFWHIDHIVPLARLASDDPNSERTKYAWGLHNLRPMLAQRNLDKSSLYEGKRWTYEEGLVTPFKLPNEDRYI